VLDETEPTPESAQAIEDLAADVLSEPLPLNDASVVSSEASSMTDTGFGRAVDSFVGESTGPLVESRAEAPKRESHAEPEPDTEIQLASAVPDEVDAKSESEAADELAALQLDEPAEAQT
jgi:hypothetical protein